MIFFTLKMAIRVLAVFLVGVIIYLGVTAVQVWLTSRQHADVTADAIVVMGSAEYNGTPSPDLKARLDEAALLSTEHRASLIAVTGAREAGDAYTEAGVSKTYLISLGISPSSIIVGGGSDSYENISSVAPALKARGVRTVLMVSDPFHEDRSMAIASTFGFVPYPDPTTTSPLQGWGTVSYFAKETVAVAAGRLIGYGNLSRLSHPVG